MPPRTRLTAPRAATLGLFVLLLLSVPLLSACLDEAGDTSYDYDNDNYTLESGSSDDDEGEMEIVYVDSVQDVVIIMNTGTVDINITDYVLREIDEEDTIYTFGGLTLPEEGYIRIHRGSGTGDTNDVYWESGENWVAGETAVILNAAGTILDACESDDSCWGQ